MHTITTIKSWVGHEQLDECQDLAYDGTYIYAALIDTIDIIKIDQATMCIVATYTSGAGGCFALVLDGTDLYGAIGSGVIKLNAATLTLETTCSTTDSAQALAIDANFVYAYLNVPINPTLVKIAKSTMTISATKIIAGRGAIHVLGNYIYTHSGIDSIAQYDTATLTLQGTCSIGTLDAGQSITDDGTYVYAASRNNICQIDPATITVTSIFNLAVGNNAICGLAHQSGFLYAPLYDVGVTNKIVRVETTGMTKVDEWTAATGQTYLYSVRVVGNNVIVGTNTSPVQVIKIDWPSLTTISYWKGQSQDLCLDLCNLIGYTYVALYVLPAMVVKLDPATMLEIGHWYGNASQLGCNCMYTDGSFLYPGLGNGVVAPRLVKIDPITMSAVAEWVGVGIADVYAINGDANYLYAGLYTSPATVVKIDKSTMTTVATWTGATGQDYPYGICKDSTYLYVGLGTTPAAIIKINIATMTTAAVWTGASGQHDVNTVVMKGTSLFTGLATSPAQIVKIAAVDMLTRASWIAPIGQDSCSRLMIQGRALWAGLNDIPTDVYRFSLGSMRPTHNWKGDPTQGQTYGLADGSNIFVGTLTSPAQVAKLPLVRSMLLGNIIVDQLIYQHAERMVR